MTIYASQVEQLLQNAKHGRIGLGALKTALPNVFGQLVADRQSPLLNCWALSVNYDEHAAARITNRKLLNVLGRCVRYPIRDGKAYHAGLLHTYGYLLSLLETRFGFKHERWTDGQLETGLGIPRGIFMQYRADGTDPSAGTLLQNASYFFLKCLELGGLPDQRLGELNEPLVSKPIRDYDYTKLRVELLRETIEIWGGSQFELCSRLIYFLHPLASGTEPTLSPVALLIYSVKAADDAHEQLVTGFPIAQAGIDELLNPECLGGSRAVRLRFNALVPGFPRDAFGLRELVQLHPG